MRHTASGQDPGLTRPLVASFLPALSDVEACGVEKTTGCTDPGSSPSFSMDSA